MSTTPEPESIFSDTSVLFNYTFRDDDGSARTLIVQDPCSVVATESVRREFQGVRDRRLQICDEILPYAQQNRINEYEPEKPDELSDNDWNYVEAFRSALSPIEPFRAVKRVNQRRRLLKAGWTDLFDDGGFVRVVSIPPRDPQLKGHLESTVENDADCRIICDAVEWGRQDGSGIFVTSDKDDTLGHADSNTDDQENSDDGLADSFLGLVEGDDRSLPEQINDHIENRYSSNARLDICSVADYLVR